jgi:hypothetical protein
VDRGARVLLIVFLSLSASCSVLGPPPPVDECLSGPHGSGGGGGIRAQPGTWVHPLGSTLDVFERPRRDSDMLPMTDCSVLRTLDLANDPNLPDPQIGKPLVSQSRRALADVANPRRDIFLIPTDEGQLCSLVTTVRGSHACGGWSGPGWHIWDLADEPPFIWGDLPDRVVLVSVEWNSMRRYAQVGENAFFFQFPEEVGTDFDAFDLFIEYENGSVDQIDPH